MPKGRSTDLPFFVCPGEGVRRLGASATHYSTGSPQRMRGGGFSFEVQQVLAEGLGWGFPVKAFSGRVVVGGDEGLEVGGVELVEIGLARQETAHAADGVLDAAFLPGRVGITKIGSNPQRRQFVVPGELGAVIEGHGLAQLRRQRPQGGADGAGDRRGLLAGQRAADQGAAHPLVQHQDGLAIFGKGHQIGFPMARDQTIGHCRGAFAQRHPVRHQPGRTAPALAAPAAFGFGARQIMAPAIILVPPDLGVDEAIYALGPDAGLAKLAGASGNLFG